MTNKPSYEELEKRVQKLEKELCNRTQAEEALRESEKRYRSLVERSSDWLWEVDAEGHYVYASPGIREILGYSPDEVIGRTPFDLMSEEEAQRAGAVFARFVTNRLPFALFENVKLHRDGTPVVLETSGVPVFDSDGEFTGYRGMGRDVTARKRTEEALKERERKFRATFDQTFQFMGLLTVNGRLIAVNSNALQFVGVKESDVAGEPFWQTSWWTHSSEQQAKLRAALAKAAAGELVRFESNHFSADRILHHMDFSLKPVKDEAGDIAFLIAEARDITERKRMEEALRESKAYLDAAIESLPFEFWAIDSNGSYIAQNRSCRERYGDIVGKKPEDVCPSEHILKIWLDNNRRAFAGELVQGEARYILGSEEQFIYNVAVPIRDSGRTLGILGINIDITERKVMERKLRQARDQLELRVQARTAELEKANEELRKIPSRLIAAQEEERRRLAAELHDSIGQTLAALKFRLELILVIFRKGHAKKAMQLAEEFIPILQRSIEETRAIYMGLRPKVLEDFGVIAALRVYRDELIKLHPEQHIEFDISVEEKEVPPQLVVPIFRIAQEALNNASKHSKAEWVDISISRDHEDGIVLEVADDGRGMDFKAILASSNARSLGLTSMKERAEMFGGSLSVQSAPGEGTTIRACWPFVQPRL